ncbi:MAG: nucleotidyltransferase family protein [Clostridiales bacterium]|nr:nucleotidyltransferase family protein [Clostridiales bacterium]
MLYIFFGFCFDFINRRHGTFLPYVLQYTMRVCALNSDSIHLPALKWKGEGSKKMDIVGIICEYDPFHRGHQRQFELIRQKKPDAYIVCLMSGCFTQRGMPALYQPSFRAEAALKAGCDLVLELPTAFALRDAQHFARGGVEIFHKLGFISHISFGCEDPPELLAPVAEALHSIGDSLLPGMKKGLSYPAAVDEYLQNLLPGCSGILSKPNNILGIQYLRALMDIGSAIEPLPVVRDGDYHATELANDRYPSASAIRKAICEGRKYEAEAACGYPLPEELTLCRPDSLDMPLIYRLRSLSAEQISLYPCCTEGLENRIMKAARNNFSRENVIQQIKTRRYPYTRISRILTQIMLGMDSALLAQHPSPEYVRILGIRKDAKPLLGQLGKSPFPLVSKAADGNLTNPLYQLDIQAYDLWALGARLPAGLMFRQGMVVL